MFQYQSLFRIITLPVAINNQSNEKQGQFKSSCNFRKTVYEKASQFRQKQADCDLRKSTEKADFVFENDFKRKYYSVCSQMIKLKKQWQNQKENRASEAPRSKFYERVGSTLLKGLDRSNQIKNKSKGNLNFPKNKQSLKLVNENSQKNIKSSILKSDNFSFKEMKLERELTIQKKLSICKRSKALSNCSIEQVNKNEITDLKGWNHLQDIAQDDLYEAA